MPARMTAFSPALYAARARCLSPLNIVSSSLRYLTPPWMVSVGSMMFWTPKRLAVSGMSCISPRAPARDTADGLKPDSAVITAWTAVHGTAHAATETVAAIPAAMTETPAPQKRVTEYLSKRYRVADGAIKRVVAVAYEAADIAKIDPLLVLAVTAVESSMTPFAQSSVGAQGLMQVHTRVHTEKFEVHGGEEAALDPVANVRVGTVILADLVRRGGSVERGLQLYVGAGNLPDDGGYGTRVLAEHSRLKLAAAGRVESALAAGRPAPAVQPSPAAVKVAVPPPAAASTTAAAVAAATSSF